MSQEDEGSYNNTHRAFLQAFLARQSLTLTEAKPLLAAIESANSNSRRAIPPEDITAEDFDNYVNSLNNQISAFDFEIRFTLHQATKERVYALVNTTSDAITQMSTLHSADEIAFVKRVLDAMFETFNTPRAEIMAITGMQALRLAKPPQQDGENRRQSSTQNQNGNANTANAGLTGTQAEKVMDNMLAEGWFELSQKGYYTLSPRALMELRGWLIDMYNDREEVDDEDEDEEAHVKIKSCAACRDIVTVGQRCPNLVCQVRLHNHCIRNMFRARGGQEECPGCKQAWVEPPPVGEKAAKKGRDSQINGRGSGARRRTSAMEDASGGASD